MIVTVLWLPPSQHAVAREDLVCSRPMTELQRAVIHVQVRKSHSDFQARVNDRFGPQLRALPMMRRMAGPLVNCRSLLPYWSGGTSPQKRHPTLYA